jgi:hypothetical protein
VFKLINLLHAGTSFVSMLYTLGRYYRRDWIVEFNIAICMDLRIVYDKLTASIVHPAPKEILEYVEALH